jgi:hypothetical protein
LVWCWRGVKRGEGAGGCGGGVDSDRGKGEHERLVPLPKNTTRGKKEDRRGMGRGGGLGLRWLVLGCSGKTRKREEWAGEEREGFSPFSVFI